MHLRSSLTLAALFWDTVKHWMDRQAPEGSGGKWLATFLRVVPELAVDEVRAVSEP